MSSNVADTDVSEATVSYTLSKMFPPTSCKANATNVMVAEVRITPASV
jgi:hypothetical protein